MLLMIVCSLALTACANQPAATPQSAEAAAPEPEGIVAEGKLKPLHAANLSFQARGIVEEINVQVGDTVQQGDILARLSNSDVALAQWTAANLELTQAQQAHDQLLRTEGLSRSDAWTAYLDAQVARAEAERAWEALNVNDIEDRIDDADAEVEDRQSDLKDAQEEFDKYKDLDQDNSKRKTAEDALEQAQEDYNEAVRKLEETTRERDAARARLDAAIAAEAEAQHTYEQTSAGPNQEQLALLTSRLENAKAQVAAAEDVLATYQLTAPFGGVVAEVAVEVGEQVSPEARAVSVADTSAWIIETTDVTELEVVGLAVGQQVTFRADALPEVIMDGTVIEISQSSFIQGGDVIYTVRIQAEDVDPRLKWGMTVEVNFQSLEK
jgi:multidrug efflux pump subunit AcrA (membrane-fusion protein)